MGEEWMRDWEVSEYMSEILLSYRLFFGQDKSSREVFWKVRPNEVFGIGVDSLLSDLCGSKSPISGIVRDRPSYALKATFPFLRRRIILLKSHLDERKPKSWREVWNDRRDSAQ
jgi:hypothetical protein